MPDILTELITAQELQVLGAPESADRHYNAPTPLSASEDEALEAAHAEWAGKRR